MFSLCSSKCLSGHIECTSPNPSTELTQFSKKKKNDNVHFCTVESIPLNNIQFQIYLNEHIWNMMSDF